MRLGRGTIKKFVDAEVYPEPTMRKSKGFSKLKPFEQYLQQRWNNGQKRVKTLFAEIKEKGYTGGLTTVYDYVVREFRNVSEDELREKFDKTQAKKVTRKKLENLTPRQAAWLMMCKSDKLKELQKEELKRLLRIHGEVEVLYRLVQDFREMLMEHKIGNWGSWIERAKAVCLPPILSFVGGLERDADAVKAAIVSEISNGQVEGQVNRLKLIKRQMFGRAKLDLLKARVLART